MKQTAVEQFLDAIKNQIPLSNEHLEMIESYASQAKAMEKKQIIDAHINGQSEFDKCSYTEHNKKLANEYYEEVLNGSH